MTTLDTDTGERPEEAPPLLVGKPVTESDAPLPAPAAPPADPTAIQPASFVREAAPAAVPAAVAAASRPEPATPTRRAVLAGTVLAGGEASAGCTVVFHPENPQHPAISVVADETGAWQIRHPPDGAGLLEFLPANCLLGEGLGSVHRRPVEAGEVNVVERIPTAWVVLDRVHLKLGAARGVRLVQQPLPGQGRPSSFEPTRSCSLPADPALEPIVMPVSPSYLVFYPGPAQVLFDPPALEVREGEYHRVTIQPAAFGTVLVAPWEEASYEPQLVLFEPVQVEQPWADGSFTPKEVRLVPGTGEFGAARAMHLLPPGRWRVKMRGPIRHMSHWSDEAAWSGPDEVWSSEFLIGAGQELELALDYEPGDGRVSVCGRMPESEPSRSE